MCGKIMEPMRLADGIQPPSLAIVVQLQVQIRHRHIPRICRGCTTAGKSVHPKCLHDFWYRSWSLVAIWECLPVTARATCAQCHADHSLILEPSQVSENAILEVLRYSIRSIHCAASNLIAGGTFACANGCRPAALGGATQVQEWQICRRQDVT